MSVQYHRRFVDVVLLGTSFRRYCLLQQLESYRLKLLRRQDCQLLYDALATLGGLMSAAFIENVREPGPRQPGRARVLRNTLG